MKHQGYSYHDYFMYVKELIFNLAVPQLFQAKSPEVEITAPRADIDIKGDADVDVKTGSLDKKKGGKMPKFGFGGKGKHFYNNTYNNCNRSCSVIWLLNSSLC